ncbi:MAG: hypothetical protein J5501_02275 [Ruminococcus sp.]|nr:hypothetical protein [Ruminococcus sp.]
MDKNAIIKGAAVGAAAGLACYVFSSAGPMRKNSIRKNAGRTLKAAESLIDDLAAVFR